MKSKMPLTMPLNQGWRRLDKWIDLTLNRSLKLNLFRACSLEIKIKSKIKNLSARLDSTAVIGTVATHL